MFALHELPRNRKYCSRGRRELTQELNNPTKWYAELNPSLYYCYSQASLRKLDIAPLLRRPLGSKEQSTIPKGVVAAT